eukprot:CAMPEP_0206512306 /NCGR_PEP_ID=MMETSP0324_2-20121206/60803_1 /ASSEMBLY_ACC=CAM_ASM_000836 /TAXON_ID=2866 /ORGANISM="Crypthecodinium cohnii, Strain Seligo" /LENGTH=32 /DNA_ID= /DNA_START= /DNA_END= /DNA_ORIENTATION=
MSNHVLSQVGSVRAAHGIWGVLQAETKKVLQP